jgi:apolipoprotein D and lipocalin family protein
MKPVMTIMFFFITSCLMAQSRELPTVAQVEINRYVGKWYAISALPQFFTRKCLAQTADYAVINEQTISVLNTCLKGKGKTTIEGQAVVTNAASNAELEVTFNSFFTRLFRVKGDYNIIALDEKYENVVVGTRDRKSLWIMSRSPNMDQATYTKYVALVRELGFPVENLIISKF